MDVSTASRKELDIIMIDLEYSLILEATSIAA
jgi:hypothetical protein